MQTVYFICAVAGATALVWQFVMGVFGSFGEHDLGDDHDVELHDGDVHDGEVHADVHDGDAGHEGQSEASHEAQASWFLGILTFRSVISAMAFFGFAGMAAVTSGSSTTMSFMIAVAAGTGALYMVTWLMRGLNRLRAEGTAQIRRAVGKTGAVYLTVPAARTGCGKVMINLQNRTMEYQAVTTGVELPTGTPVVVVGIVGTDTLEVLHHSNPVQASSPETTSHV